LRFKLLLVCSLAVFGQSSGQILGTVADRSGAVMPAVAVRAVNEATGLEWATETDAGGRFNLPRVPVGNYRLLAAKDGFRQFRSESFRLDADQSRELTVNMELGATTESVTVSGAVAQVDTVNATIREVVDEKRISELPLNGRNPLQLVQLVPGAVTGPASGSLSRNDGIAVNGSRGTGTNYLLDGGDNNDPQENVGAVVPNPDALEEFSVQTNNYSAEYGRSSGGVVNAITKAGTNRFKGSVWEFLRNDALDARSFFALSKGALRRNQFGASAGGPIVKNKAFFFGSYEGVRQRRGGVVSNLVVPTQAERGGDFNASTQKPRDPVTNQPFPNALIPASRIDAASRKYMDLLQIPAPNASGNRHIFNTPEATDSDQYLGRVDYALSSSQRLNGRFFETTATDLLVAGLPILRSDVKFDTWNVSGQHTWTASPSVLFVTQYTWNQSQIDRGPIAVPGVSYQDMGIRVNRGAVSALGKELAPHFRGGVNGFWNLNQDNLVLIDRTTHQFLENGSWTRGSHFLKFGGEYRWGKSDRITANGVDPQFTFNGQFTGNSFGDFLLGRALNFTQGSVRINQIRAQTYGLYIQDDWKIKPRLSLNLGLRYEPLYPFYSAADELTVFRPGRGRSRVFPAAPEGLLYAGDEGVPRGGTGSDLNNFAPRFGFAWSPFKQGKTSIRGAYGFFYDLPRFHQVSHFVNSPPYSLQITVNQTTSLTDPYAGRPNPFPYAPPVTQQEKAAYRFLLPVTVGLTVDPFFRAPYMQQWNFNVQHQLAKDYVFTASYVGTKGTRLPIRRELNPAIFRAGYQSVINYENTINSNYHAFQTTLNKRYSRGFTVLASYNWSKSIDGMSLDVDGFNGQNPLDSRPDKGLSDFDVRHRFVASFLWEMPGPKTGVARHLLGGWQSNGIFIGQAGRPFTIVSGQDRALAGTGTQRPDVNGSPRLDSGRSRDELMAGYFNPAVYSLPAMGSFGNSGRNVLTGPGNYNLDFALFKKFSIRESWQLQYRWEMFNALNHANLGQPRSNISAVRPGQIDTTSGPRNMQMGLRMVF